ncbi:MAG: alkaline phosphatase [Leptothrix sp. (in: b-proteobacteria)]
MTQRMPPASRHCHPCSLLAAAALAAMGALAAPAVRAAPVISRLTPPSNPAQPGVSALARFLAGQKFDLQATVRPDVGQTISQVVFAVDGVTVATVKAPADSDGKSANPANPANTGFIADATNSTLGNASGSLKGLSYIANPNTAVVSLRGYSHAAGTPSGQSHRLTATATQSDGQVVSASGNFEIVSLTAGGQPAKNVIILLGDGMGAAHRTAARIAAKGYLQGKAQGRLAMDTFPVSGMVMTASLDSIVTDSAPGMSNYVNGNKAANNQEGVFPDDTFDAFDNPRIEYLSEYLKRTQGTSLGVVTTADVFDATPAANAVHTAQRGHGTGIVDQFLDDRNLTGLSVLMGGGRKWFIPKSQAGAPFEKPVVAANGSARSTASDYRLAADLVSGWGASAGAIDPERNLVADFQAAGFAYAPDKAGLDRALAAKPGQLLGLFNLSNMNVAYDKLGGRRGTSSVTADYGFPDQPLLEEMTDAALAVLGDTQRHPNGFVLMVEGASIDKQSHLMDSERWIVEVIEFDNAVARAQAFARAHPDTLVIVTADHECSGAAIIGASTQTTASLQALAAGDQHGSAAQRDKLVGVYEAARFPQYPKHPVDGYPASMDPDHKMLIGYGANADRYESWLTTAQPQQDSQQPLVGAAPLNTHPTSYQNRDGVVGKQVRNAATGLFITGQVPGNQAVHTAADIPLSAFGHGAQLLGGVMDNTDVFFHISQAMKGVPR